MIGLVGLVVMAGCSADPEATCGAGLDLDGDGVCDHLRADWSATAELPEEGHRSDIYQLGPDDLAAVREAGLQHAYRWPVTVSGVLLPYGPLERFLGDAESDPNLATLQAMTRRLLGFGDLDEMYDWLGLARHRAGEGLYDLPLPDGMDEGAPLGVGLVETPHGEALTFSCAACHTTELFGKTVMGLTNRKTRANEFFHLAETFFVDLDASFFQSMTGATEDEMVLFYQTQAAVPAVGVKVPEVLGLDTSLAQVSLSLARREEDGWATRSTALEADPRSNGLETFVADSKPAVWWNLKYKTRWLSDGSIVSGNPIHTNFLWNEIGRATDLRALEAWFADEQQAVDELTVAVFATEAPRWADFFPDDLPDLEAAKRGQVQYAARCAACHGSYEKAWEDAAVVDPVAQLATVRLDYPRTTPVYDVGTDGQRAEGMVHFAAALNDLQISKNLATVVEVQPGYVPPPLDAVWARYPYLHHGAVPTLCELLTPAAERSPVFYMGPTDDPATDFDAACVGYPVGEAVPPAWTEDPRRRYDTSRPGLGNAGHDEMLGPADGLPALDEAARADLIAFLKTL